MDIFNVKRMIQKGTLQRGIQFQSRSDFCVPDYARDVGTGFGIM